MCHLSSTIIHQITVCMITLCTLACADLKDFENQDDAQTKTTSHASHTQSLFSYSTELGDQLLSAKQASKRSWSAAIP